MKNVTIVGSIAILLAAGVGYTIYRYQQITASSSAIQPELTSIPTGQEGHSSDLKPTSSPEGNTATQNKSLTFLNPAQGTMVNAGETVTVEISGPGMKEILLVAPNFAQTATNNGTDLFIFQYPIPIDSIAGPISLDALGKSSTGPLLDLTLGQAKEVPLQQKLTINVKENQTMKIISIMAYPNELVLLNVGETEQLEIMGTMENGKQINLTSAASGTEYVTNQDYVKKYSPYSQNIPPRPEVIRVDAEGKITALQKGEDSLVISHPGTKAVTVQVIVE